MTEVKSEDLKSLNESLSVLNEKAAAIHGRQGLAAWVQVVIAAFAVLATTISAVNNVALDKVKQAQSTLEERQKELAQKASILHESLTLFDTRDADILQKKILLQLQLLVSILSDAENTATTQGGREFYSGLANSLSKEIRNADTRDQMLAFIAAQTATGISGSLTRVPRADTKAAAPAAAPPSATPPSPPMRQAEPPRAIPASRLPASAHGEATSFGAPQAMDVDVIWCVRNTPYESTNENEALAEVLYFGLVDRQQSAGLGRVRLRRLPELVNQTPPYEISTEGVIIRTNDDKLRQAQQFKSWVSEDLAHAGLDRPILLEQGRNKLPLYLPIYVCNEE